MWKSCTIGKVRDFTISDTAKFSSHLKHDQVFIASSASAESSGQSRSIATCYAARRGLKAVLQAHAHDDIHPIRPRSTHSQRIGRVRSSAVTECFPFVRATRTALYVLVHVIRIERVAPYRPYLYSARCTIINALPSGSFNFPYAARGNPPEGRLRAHYGYMPDSSWEKVYIWCCSVLGVRGLVGHGDEGCASEVKVSTQLPSTATFGCVQFGLAEKLGSRCCQSHILSSRPEDIALQARPCR